QRSVLNADGSSTPAKRMSESEMLDRVASAFGIHRWPVAAVKAYRGHPLGPASGDQLVAALGSFHYGIIPGIKTIDAVADDVHQQHLHISVTDIDKRSTGLDVAFINSKGFGGNNATAVVLSPTIVERMLTKRYGAQTMAAYQQRKQTVQARSEAYNQAALRGRFNVQYHFGENLLDDADLEISAASIRIPGFAQAIDYDCR